MAAELPVLFLQLALMSGDPDLRLDLLVGFVELENTVLQLLVVSGLD